MRFDKVQVHQSFTDTFNTEWKKVSKNQAQCLSKDDKEYVQGAVEQFGAAEEVTLNEENHAKQNNH